MKLREAAAAGNTLKMRELREVNEMQQQQPSQI